MDGLSGPFYTLVGPTAVGKSRIAHKLAKKRGCAVISSDSMLVYRGMDIGTAKPSLAERAEVTYLGLDLADPCESFSTGDYFRHVQQSFGQLTCPPIIAGGTGLYVRCLMQGIEDVPPADEALRTEGQDILDSGGIKALQQWAESKQAGILDKLDDPMNHRRIIRALEWLEVGGLPVSWAHQEKPKMVGLYMDRTILKERIALRVHQMYDEGLLDEAAQLRHDYVLSPTALQAIGYSEAFAVLDRTMSQDEAIEKTTVRTRRLAKRQLTWFRNQADVQWISITPEMDDEDIMERVELQWNKRT